MDTVVKFSERLQKVESELKQIRGKSCTCDRADGNISSNECEDNTDVSQSPDSGDDIVHNELLIPLNSDIPTEDDGISTNNESNENGSNDTTSVSQSEDPRRPPRVTPAVTDFSDLYIGGASSNVTESDVIEDLISAGLRKPTIKVRTLKENGGWKSFVATIPKDKVKYLCQNSPWSGDIKVRPFREDFKGYGRIQPHKQEFREGPKRIQKPSRPWKTKISRPLANQRNQWSRDSRFRPTTRSFPPRREYNDHEHTTRSAIYHGEYRDQGYATRSHAYRGEYNDYEYAEYDNREYRRPSEQNRGWYEYEFPSINDYYRTQHRY